MERYILVYKKGEQASEKNAVPLVMSYRISPGGLQFCDAITTQTRGGYLCVSDKNFKGALPEINDLYSQIIAQCNKRQFAGVLLDFENSLRLKAGPLVQALSERLASRRIDLIVDSQYANVAKSGKVLIGSELTGGSFASYLDASCKRFGARRLVLELSPMRRQFSASFKDERGKELTEETLAELVRSNRGKIYYSKDLCVNHFHMNNKTIPHYVLFDNNASLKDKINLAKQAGIETFTGFYEDVKGILPL